MRIKLSTLNSPYIIVFAASAVIASMFILFYSNSKNNEISEASVAHTQEVIQSSDDLLVALVNHQSSIRGYLLTSDTSFLDPYETSLPTLNFYVRELDRLTINNPQQQRRLDRLDVYISDRIAISEKIIAQNQKRPLDVVQKAASAQEGKIITDKIKALLVEINSTEDKLLVEKNTLNDANKENKSLLFTILLICSFALLIYAIFNIRKNAIRVKKSQVEKVALEHQTLNLEAEKAIAVEFGRQSQLTIAAKQQFLANMSHEIRTPMTAIIGFSKVLLKTELTDQQQDYIAAIKTSSDSLLVLINDILDLAKVDSGKMTFEEKTFEMETDISAMLNLFDLKIKEKNLALTMEYDKTIPRVLLGDSVRLNQIILNLMSNAIKFTAKGKITVSVRLIDSSQDKVTVEFIISDTGIGIAENSISSIFESFQQASTDTAMLFGGTGLGLAIVKQLVERQGGTIAVSSTLNKGSTFSFVLNFKKTKSELEQESSFLELIPDIKKIKVLVVEDVALNQLLMKIILDDFGFKGEIAENGKVAIEKLQNNSYDIILMDLQMPEMNGFEATEYIRKKMNSTIPIIALTADVTAEDLTQCKSFGMNGHIAKPIDEKLLYAKIIELVKP